MRWLLGAILFSLAACRFDSSVPDSAQISCASSGDPCPTGTVCRVSIGLCVPQGLEQVLPSLLKSSLSPTTGKAGTQFEVWLEPDEPLFKDPTVSIGSRNGDVF